MKHPARRTHIVDNHHLFGKIVEHAEIPPMTLHDLRRSFVNAGDRAGLTEEENAAATGQSKQAQQGSYMDKGAAARRKAERNRPHVAVVTEYIANLAKSA